MKKKISICIPVYNRKTIFKCCLEQASKACEGYSQYVEIVVSDNNSEDNIETIVEEVRNKYRDIEIKYQKNMLNIGMAKNFLKVVEIASGEFCWIIGSDDFLKIDSIKKVLNILKSHNEICFISCNYDLLNINQLTEQDSIIFDFIEKLNSSNEFIEHKAPKSSYPVDRFDKLVDPIYDNVFLGAIMVGIFKKELWDKVNQSNVNWDGFNSLAGIYPHCYIYSKSFIGERAYYCGDPLITVGEGTRDWSIDTGKCFWESHLPLIYFNVLGDIIRNYKKYGLDKTQYKKCKNDTARISGRYLLPILIRKYITNKYIVEAEKIDIKKEIKYYIFTLSFYIGIVQSILSLIKSAIMR